MITKRFSRFEEIDWSAWTPTERATLLFVLRDDHILLIHKKRGLGAGKINGPGGRIDPGETPEQGAIREVQEELLVTATGVQPAGELKFQFVDGYSLHGYVFKASGCDGHPTETFEATPHWFPCSQIPYQEMWADDRIWIPLMLAGRTFEGKFLFDGDEMLGYEVSVETRHAASLQDH